MVLIEHAELRKRIYAGRFLTTLYEIDVDGAKHRVIPRDFQLDAIKDLPMHVDFLRVAEGASIRVKIPVHVLGTEPRPASSAAVRSISSPTPSRWCAQPTPFRNRSTSTSASSTSAIPST